MATGVDPAVIAYLDATLGDRSTPVSQERLRELATIPKARTDAYATARNYYDGKQGTLLTDRAKAYLERSGLSYCENFCATVVDALAERLHVTGVTSDLGYEPDPAAAAEGEQPEDELADWLWDVFDRSRGDELQTDVHTETTKTGDAFVIVDWNAATKRPRLTYQPADLINMVYEDRQPVCAVKLWTTTRKSPVNPTSRAVRRMNIYWPDRIDKWFCPAKEETGQEDTWVEWLDEGDAKWPVSWTFTDGTPIGLPVFHFANLKASDCYGQAEHRQTIPQQDRLNKELLDLAAVMDAQGFPQRWAKGVSDTSSLTSDPGVVWSSDNPSAEFGQFEAAPPDGLLKSVESTLIRLATRSRTPAHLIYLTTGGVPSGESLKTAESGLVKKAKNRQVYHGGTWAEVFRMTALVAIAFGADAEKPSFTVEDIRGAALNVTWDDPETRNEKEHLDSLVVMQTLGVSDDTILTMIPGIDPAAEREKKAADKEASGEALLEGAINPANMMPNGMQVIEGGNVAGG